MNGEAREKPRVSWGEPLSRRSRNRIIVAIAFVAWAGAGQAQGIFIARRVIGHIEQMSQTSPGGETTYDTASVIVDVPVDRVYAAVKTQVSTAQGITVTREDPAARRIEFTNGTQIAGIQAVALGENVTQLMVSSAHSKAPATPASMIVQHIVAACKAMNVECTHGS